MQKRDYRPEGFEATELNICWQSYI